MQQWLLARWDDLDREGGGLSMAIFYVPPTPKERKAREEEWRQMIKEAKKEVA